MTFYKWSITAADNSNADSTINWAEGQAPSSVNDSARALMAAAAKYRDDMAGLVITTGTSTAYVATSNQGYTVQEDGNSITVQFHTTCGAAPTLNLDSMGAAPIRTATGVAPGTGRILAGSIHRLTYDQATSAWILHGFVLDSTVIEATTKMLFQQTNAPTGWTKDTTHNNKALRVVSGTASSGGSVDFTTAFASKSVAGTVGDTTLTENQIPNHGHPFRTAGDGETSSDPFGGFLLGNDAARTNNSAFTGTPSDTLGQQIGGTGGGQSHTHSFTGTAINLAVQYVDLIIATKD